MATGQKILLGHHGPARRVEAKSEQLRCRRSLSECGGLDMFGSAAKKEKKPGRPAPAGGRAWRLLRFFCIVVFLGGAALLPFETGVVKVSALSKLPVVGKYFPTPEAQPASPQSTYHHAVNIKPGLHISLHTVVVGHNIHFTIKESDIKSKWVDFRVHYANGVTIKKSVQADRYGVADLFWPITGYTPKHKHELTIVQAVVLPSNRVIATARFYIQK